MALLSEKLVTLRTFVTFVVQNNRFAQRIELSGKANLRIIAVKHGHSMEEEVRCILRQVIENEA